MRQPLDGPGILPPKRLYETSVPTVIPYVTNLVSDGALKQDVLNTTQFLDDWVELCAQSNDAGDGLHAMPAPSNVSVGTRNR